MTHSEQLKQMRTLIQGITPITEEAWQAFSSIMEPSTLAKGEHLFREDTFPKHIIFLNQGVIRAYYASPEGTEYNKTFFTENTFAGPLTSLVRRESNLINFQALEDCSFLKARWSDLQDIYAQHHCLERLGRKIVEWEWTNKEVREIRLVTNDATQRYFFFQEEHPGLENRIPQYHIASYLGITPIQLSRIRAKLARKR